jgi:hypothetical protein
LVALMAAACSIAFQGAIHGFGNNVYHIPIMLGLVDLPQFADDAYIQSLRRFASFVYPLLGRITTDANLVYVFAVAHLLTRTALILAVFQVAMSVLPQARRFPLVVMACIVVPATLYGASPVGVAGLFSPIFSHTEFAQAVGVVSLCLAARRRLLLAALAWGLAFDLNLLVGVWCAMPLALLAAAEIRHDGRRALPMLAAAAAVAAVVALPNLIWVLQIIGQDRIDFDYPEYLRAYFPYHFLIAAAKPYNVAVLALHIVAGALALREVRASWRWTVIYAGLVLLFGIGVILPSVTASQHWLGLQLLRADGMIVLVGTGFAVAALSALVMDADAPQERRYLALLCLAFLTLGYWPGSFDWAHGGIGLLLLALLCATAAFAYAGAARSFLSAIRPVRGKLRLAREPLPWLGLVLLLLAFYRGRLVHPDYLTIMVACASFALAGVLAWRPLRPGLKPAMAIVAMLGIVNLAIADHRSPSRSPSGLPRDNELLGLQPLSPEWLQVARWAREATPPMAVFLVPPYLAGFDTEARRRVWYSFAQGAAVLWQPAFHATWMQRRAEVSGIASAAEARVYACRHGITHLVVDLRPDAVTGRTPDQPRLTVTETPGLRPAFGNRLFQVYAVDCAA